ncbi:FAD-dependent oxidoreductase [Candidatus Bipolaricaulota bacterium]|nr:FAD-dependent oxidoreductase [Candidatus Bipolaricaulota bacterium]
MQKFDYAIVGAGLAGASAVKGIRKEDQEGSILLVGREEQFPYNRPPLSKDLLLGDKTVEEIKIEDEGYYAEQGVELQLGTEITEIDPDSNLLTDDRGKNYEYGKLLVATGGSPRKLDIPGGRLDAVNYYRQLGDYKSLRERLDRATKAVVIGGGFIGSEITAGLIMNDIEVSVVFPEDFLLQRVLPEELAPIVQRDYRDHGAKVIPGDKPTRISKGPDGLDVKTEQGKLLHGDLVVAGIGISPEDELAKDAGLKVYDGVEVDECLKTSDPDIYAAGDNAYFPFSALGESLRVEHWDNAKSQGELAGENMAGAGKTYDYVPYFFSDLFDFGFEAVGDLNSRLDNFMDWKEKGKTGVGYYLSKDGKVRGVLLVGVWGAKGDARDLVKSEESFSREDLVGMIG